MAQDLSLLFTLKAQNQASPAINTARADVIKLRQTIGSEFGQIQRSATTSLGQVTQSLTRVTAGLPVVGNAVNGLSTQFGTMTTASTAAGGSLALLAGGAIIGAAALNGIVRGAIGAVSALFDLAKRTAEFGDTIGDTAEKTALSVQTVSALAVAGKEAGITVDQMSGGLVRFVRNLEEAAAGNKKLATELKSLGVTAFHDADEALKQFLAGFAKLKTDQERTLAATELFGARFGATLIETFGKVGGDLEKFKTRLRELGLLMSDEEAAAADEFTKALADLGIMLSGLERQIGQATIPAFIAGFEAVSAALEANKTDWRSWGETIAKIILTVEALIGGFATVAANADWTNLIPLYGPGKAGKEFLRGVNETADKVTEAYNRIVNPPLGAAASVSLGQPRFSIPTGTGGGRRAAPRDTALRDATREAALAEREALLITSADVAENKRALDEQVRDIEEFTRRAIELSDQVHDAAIVRINAEQEAIDRARQRRGVTPDQLRDLAIQERELTIRNTEAQRKNEEERFRLEQERDRKLAQAQIAAKNRELQIAEEADARIIARIKNRIGQQIALETDAEAELLRVRLAAIDAEKDAVNKRLEAAKTLDPRERVAQERELNAEYRALAAERASVEVALNRRLKELGEGRVFTASEAEKQIAVIIDEGFKRRREALEKEELAYSTTLERREVINAELIRLDGDRAFAAEEAARRIVRAQFDEQNAPAQGATRKRRTTDSDEIAPPSIEGQDAFSIFRQSIEDNLGGDAQTAAIAGLEVMQTAFQGLAQAVGESVQAFVLFGGAGQGLKKFTATLISEIAKMAAVQAIWELAQGFAMLALNFFWPDPRYAASATAHFHAAAIYGGMAVIAAGAGRAVAGGSFQQAGGGGAAGTGTSQGTRNPSDRGTTTGQTPAVAEGPTEINRTPGSSQPQTYTQVLEFKVKGDALVDTFTRDYMLNGRTRVVIRNDG